MVPSIRTTLLTWVHSVAPPYQTGKEGIGTFTGSMPSGFKPNSLSATSGLRKVRSSQVPIRRQHQVQHTLSNRQGPKRKPARKRAGRYFLDLDTGDRKA